MAKARPVACDLGGAGVLVTRPAHQAEPLCRLIEAHGGRTVRFPAIEIREPCAPAETRAMLAALDTYDLLVFVSANAVSRTLAMLPPGIRPKGGAQRLVAVGEATARALRECGLAVGVVPESGRYDSEGLLALPALQDMAGRRVLILRGESGRELLAAELRHRGAEVDYAEVYRRALPEVDPGPLLGAWDREVQLVLATSVDILRNLDCLVGAAGLDRLRSTPLVVASERIAQAAQARAYRRILLADGAGDAELVAALCRWVARG